MPAVRVKTKNDRQPKLLPPYHVVLLDDNHHSYGYVIVMLQSLFGHPLEKALEMAKEVDTTGRVIVLTTAKEHAEFKRDQIHAFGPDETIAACEGAMTAVIEPSE
jgi:ATP-dependent Clp protease adaptor protein ClpS